MILPNTRHRKWFGDHRQEQVINKGVYTPFFDIFLRKRIFTINDVLWFSCTTTGKKATILLTAKGFFSLSLREQRLLFEMIGSIPTIFTRAMLAKCNFG